MNKTILTKSECRKIALKCLINDFEQAGDFSDYEINVDEFENVSGYKEKGVYTKYVVIFTYDGIEYIAKNVVDEEDDLDSCILDITA